MPKPAKTLTILQVRNAKPRIKPYRLFDGGGLYLEVMPIGACYWRLKYRYLGKEKRLALDVASEVSLPQARASRERARALLRDGIDPGEQRKMHYLAARASATNSFECVAREWLQKQVSKLELVTHAKATALLEKWAFPWIGKCPVDAITPRELLESILRRVESLKPCIA